jgi:hypothetical protein
LSKRERDRERERERGGREGERKSNLIFEDFDLRIERFAGILEFRLVGFPIFLHLFLLGFQSADFLLFLLSFFSHLSLSLFLLFPKFSLLAFQSFQNTTEDELDNRLKRKKGRKEMKEKNTDSIPFPDSSNFLANSKWRHA